MSDCLNSEENDPESLTRLDVRVRALADLQDAGARAIRACRAARLAGSTSHLGDMVRGIVERLVAELPNGQSLPLEGLIGGVAGGVPPLVPPTHAADNFGTGNAALATAKAWAGSAGSEDG